MKTTTNTKTSILEIFAADALNSPATVTGGARRRGRGRGRGRSRSNRRGNSRSRNNSKSRSNT